MRQVIAIQGAKGSFHEIAAKKHYAKKPVDFLYCQTFLDVFRALESGAATSAVVAIGNNRYGDINHVYDILIGNRLSKGKIKYWISGEVYINIDLCLIGHKGTKLEEIREVRSQAPAIVQCFTYIHTKLVNAVAIEEDDTALSVRLVAEWKDKTKVAIASKEAAKIYGLEVLQESIQDDKNNMTRFLTIESSRKPDYRDSSKTSILIMTSHRPGSLVQVLNFFADNNINISYLQSVPIPNRPFEYRFYIDIDSGINNKSVKSSLSVLTKLGYHFDILGSYKQARVPKIKP